MLRTVRPPVGANLLAKSFVERMGLEAREDVRGQLPQEGALRLQDFVANAQGFRYREGEEGVRFVLMGLLQQLTAQDFRLGLLAGGQFAGPPLHSGNVGAAVKDGPQPVVETGEWAEGNFHIAAIAKVEAEDAQDRLHQRCDHLLRLRGVHKPLLDHCLQVRHTRFHKAVHVQVAAQGSVLAGRHEVEHEVLQHVIILQDLQWVQGNEFGAAGEVAHHLVVLFTLAKAGEAAVEDICLNQKAGSVKHVSGDTAVIIFVAGQTTTLLPELLQHVRCHIRGDVKLRAFLCEEKGEKGKRECV